MKKKVLASMLVMVLMASMFMTGCGGSGSESADSAEEQSEGNEEKQEESQKDKVTIEEQILLEEDGITVTATEVELGDVSRAGGTVAISVNNTTDKDYYISSNFVVVNGYMAAAQVHPESGDSFGPGETTGFIEILPMKLKYVNVENIGEIVFGNILVKEMELQEMPNLDGEMEEVLMPVEEPSYAVENCVVKTSAYDEAAIAVMPEGEVVYDEDGVQVVKVAADEEDQAQGITELFFVKNDTDKPMMLHSYNYSFNGTAVDEMMLAMTYPRYRYVNPGCIEVGYFAGVEESMEYMGMEGEFESMECTMLVSEIDEAGYPESGTGGEFTYSYTAE